MRAVSKSHLVYLVDTLLPTAVYEVAMEPEAQGMSKANSDVCLAVYDAVVGLPTP